MRCTTDFPMRKNPIKGDLINGHRAESKFNLYIGRQSAKRSTNYKNIINNNTKYILYNIICT